MATTTPRTPEETQAISRLRALGQGVRVYCLERDQSYCVPASAGDGSAYQVQVSSEITICSCPAGTNDKYIEIIITFTSASNEVPPNDEYSYKYKGSRSNDNETDKDRTTHET